MTVSVIVLNWNGKENVQKCLNSLHRVKNQSLEIIVVDNNSTDGSIDFIKKNFPKVVLVENRKNFGFAEGNNIGFEVARGDFVLILNNDTEVTNNFLNPLLKDFEDDPKIGCIQPQIRLIEGGKTLDGVGAFLTLTGFLYHFGYLKSRDLKKYTEKRNIFSAKGACMLLRRKAIETVGLFDKDFFIFFEETDLCYRLWLAGYSVVYEPRSVIYHLGGGDTTASNSYKQQQRTYLAFRNMLCSYLKNFGTRNLLMILPVFFLVQGGLIFYYLITLRIDLIRVLLRGFYWNIVHLRDTLKKRRIVQNVFRRISDSELNKQIIVNPRISYYYYILTGGLRKYSD